MNDELETTNSDLMLQKLGDIEALLRMRVQQSSQSKDDSNDNLDVANQLLVKVVKGIESMKSMKLDIEGIKVVTLKGEDGKDCEPEAVAAILKESSEFIESIKGEDSKPEDVARSLKSDTDFMAKIKGEAGKTPKKGEDYLTKKDTKEMCSEICDKVISELPPHVKSAVKDYLTPEKISKAIKAELKNNSTGKQTPIDIKDVKGFNELFKEEVQKIYDNVSNYYNRSGGGSLLLAAMKDVDTSAMQDGYTIKWSKSKNLFYFAPAGGGGTSVDIVNIVNTKTDNYTLAKTDFGKTMVMNAATAKTFNVPLTDVADVGAKVTFAKINTGKLTLQMPAATFIADSSAAGTMFNDLINEPWSTVTIQLVTATKWVVVGGMGTWTTS